MTDRIQLHYCKPQSIDLASFANEAKDQNQDQDQTNYDPFAIQDLQLYNPVYSKFFEMTPNNYDRIALNHRYHVRDLDNVVNLDQGEIVKKPVFVKFSPLLDPFRYMIGKYDVQDPRIRQMPQISSTEETVHSKILSTNNASYVDCFFNYLSSSLLHQHGIVNGIDFFGSYMGVQKSFRVCVTDDVDYLRGSDFFQKHVGELFFIEEPREVDDDLAQIGGSRRNKKRLLIDKDEDGMCTDLIVEDLDADLDADLGAGDATNQGASIDTIDLGAITLVDDGLVQTSAPSINRISDEEEDCEVVYAKSSRRSSESQSSTSSSSSKQSMDSALSYSSEEDEGGSDQGSDWSTEDEEGSGQEDDFSESEEIYGYIHNFPVQMICLEKCDGTLDQLFVQEKINEENGASALFQVIMTLLAYQKAFKFTHNDLHTNNIMYMNTDVEYLFYKFRDQVYRVPTYGRIFKLIDFGRSIYRFQDNLFCSDSFAPGGDAATQYNFEPFMNTNKPRLEPNFSFDLCRLGSSIFDFLMDVDMDPKKMDGLQQTIHRWCLDDFGKNVLYKKNGDERYPNFKLYKMIARTVHKHSPEAQLEFLFFKQYAIGSDKVNSDHGIMDLDNLPSYT